MQFKKNNNNIWIKFVFLNFRQRGKKVKNPNQILLYYCVKLRLICDFMPILDFNILVTNAKWV